MMRWLSYLCIGVGTCLVLSGALAGRGTGSSNGPRVAESSSDTRDCGAVSLFVIARLNGMTDVSLDYLTSLTEGGVRGTTMYDLKVAAEHLGFEVTGLEMTPRQLKERLGRGNRAILHLDRGHFVSAVGLSASGRIVVVDGALGASAFRPADLKRHYGWDGNALVLTSRGVAEAVAFRERQ